MSKKNEQEIVIKIEKKEWEEALTKSFNKKVNEVKIDGFRKGKVPRDIFEKKFGKESLYMDAVDVVLPDAYNKALTESKLIPVVQPHVDIKSINDEGVEIVFNIITKPEIKLGNYKNLKIKKPDLKVSKEEIAHEIEHIRKQYADIGIKEDKIADGDIAVIDFEGFNNGVAFDGGKGENYPLEIGSRTFIPGFEEQLIGMSVNENKDIKVTFPNEYPSEDLKGKEVTFKVIVKEVKTKNVPELNEVFFKDLDLPGVDSKETLEKEIEERIKASKEVENENAYVDLLLEAAAKEAKVDIPHEMIHEEIERMIGRYQDQLKMQGISIEQYYQFTNTTEEDLKAQMHNEAEKHVLYRLMLEEIAALEKINVNDKEANEEAERLADKYQMKKDEFLKLFGGLDMVKYDVQMRKAMETLKNNK
jgi:trigger factor